MHAVVEPAGVTLVDVNQVAQELRLHVGVCLGQALLQLLALGL